MWQKRGKKEREADSSFQSLSSRIVWGKGGHQERRSRVKGKEGRNGVDGCVFGVGGVLRRGRMESIGIILAVGKVWGEVTMDDR